MHIPLIEADTKDSVGNAVVLAPNRDLLEDETKVRNGTAVSKSENIVSLGENRCEMRSAKLEQEEMKKDVLTKG